MLTFKKKIPTDLQILKEIYKNHQSEFCKYSEKNLIKDSIIYIPIDIPKIASHFKTTNNIIFGRLYYSMERKYGYTKEDGSKVSIFTPVYGKETNCVNLPLLISVISGLQEQLSYFQKTFAVSFIGIAIASLSFVHSCSKSNSDIEKDKATIEALNRIATISQDAEPNLNRQDQKQLVPSDNSTILNLDKVSHCLRCHTSKN